MWTSTAFAVLSVLSFAASQEETLPPDDIEYHLNATGYYDFKAPRYSNETQPEYWKVRAALTTTSFLNYEYRSVSWLDTPYLVPVNGSSITRDVCLFMQLPTIKLAGPIDYEQGRNGCNHVLGEECALRLAEYLAERYEERTASNGTMECTSTNNFNTWRQDIYNICPSIKETGGSGYAFRTLIPNNHENGSALHGNYTGYWTAMKSEADQELSSEAKYDAVAQYVYTYFIISGPEYGSMNMTPTVDMVCVKPENVEEGSRSLPGESSASGLVVDKAMLSMTVFLMLFAGWVL